MSRISKMIMNILFFLLLQVTACSTKAFLQEPTLRPEISEVQGSLKIQLSANKTQFYHGEKTRLTLQFTNNSKLSISVPLESVTNPSLLLRMKWLKKNNEKLVAATLANFAPTAIMLASKQSIVINPPPFYFLPGKYSFSLEFVYQGTAQSEKNNDLVARSNIISFSVSKKISLEQKKNLLAELERLGQNAPAMSSKERLRLQNIWLYLSPYSVAYIRKSLTSETFRVRQLASETLGKLANRELCSEFGFTPDTSSLADLLSAARREQSPETLLQMISSLGFFSDIIRGRNKRVAKSVLVKGLGSRREDVKLMAASILLELLPKEGRRVLEKKLKDEEFLSAGARHALQQLMSPPK